MFEGAIAWDAWKQAKDAKVRPRGAICRHQGVLGMHTTYVEARALYEFFHTHTRNYKDDALADDFARSWKATRSDLYKSYIAAHQPVNKRVFHLVYLRYTHSGEAKQKPPLKEQVLNVAQELRDLAKEFIEHIDDQGSRELVEKALQRALDEAQKASDHYGISNPLL